VFAWLESYVCSAANHDYPLGEKLPTAHQPQVGWDDAMMLHFLSHRTKAAW
jgi:hypothetical protein